MKPASDIIAQFEALKKGMHFTGLGEREKLNFAEERNSCIIEKEVFFGILLEKQAQTGWKYFCGLLKKILGNDEEEIRRSLLAFSRFFRP